jgi:hypothetical protein
MGGSFGLQALEDGVQQGQGPTTLEQVGDKPLHEILGIRGLIAAPARKA